MTAPQDPFAAPGDQPPPAGQQPPATPPGYGTPPPGYGPPPPGYPGYPPAYAQPAYGTVVTRGTNGLAIASLILGILWIYWVGSILALIFGYVALRQIKQRAEGGRGLAIAGVVLGWVGVAVIPLIVVAVFALGTSVKGDFKDTCQQFSQDGTSTTGNC